MTRAVAINGSPRMQSGNTGLILDAFIQGMRDAGAEVDLIHANRLKAHACTGELHCWLKQPGECYIRDEMQELYPLLRAAQVLVLATPVYIPLPGEMQNLINRLCPLLEPVLETREGRTRGRFRQGVAIESVTLVSTCGWWELENFDTVVRIAEEFAADAGVPFAGAVLRPHAPVMRPGGKVTAEGQAILDAVRKAGGQLATAGAMDEQTLAAIRRPLLPQEDYRRRLNTLG